MTARVWRYFFSELVSVGKGTHEDVLVSPYDDNKMTCKMITKTSVCNGIHKLLAYIFIYFLGGQRSKQWLILCHYSLSNK